MGVPYAKRQQTSAAKGTPRFGRLFRKETKRHRGRTGSVAGASIRGSKRFQRILNSGQPVHKTCLLGPLTIAKAALSRIEFCQSFQCQWHGGIQSMVLQSTRPRWAEDAPGYRRRLASREPVEFNLEDAFE